MQDETRDERGRWVKGVSGNPDGRRTRTVPDTTLHLFTNNAEKAIRVLFKLMDDPDPAIRLPAVKYFLDKGLGRNFQAFEPEGFSELEGLTVTIVSADNKSRLRKDE